MSKTIDYYNQNSKDFFESTVDSDMTAQYKMFERYLHAGARILDCGCGSGRDTKYFLDQGYDVVAFDGSREMCRLASDLTGLEVRNIIFQDIDYIKEFNGIWACASLLHVPKDELLNVMQKMSRALINGGILYVSFKFGEYEGERNGRFFTDLNNESFAQIVSEISELTILDKSITTDVRPGRDESWLNAILVKHDNNDNQ